METLPPEQQSSEAVADLFQTLATHEKQTVQPKKPVAVVSRLQPQKRTSPPFIPIYMSDINSQEEME